MHIVAESLAQRREEGERTAAEQDRSLEVDAMGESHHRLHGDGVEDAGSDVSLGQVARHEVLDVRLGEYTAAGSHRVYVSGLHGQLAHLLVVHAHQHAHLVDECTRAAGTVAIHAQLHFSTMEEDDLGVLATDVDERLGLGMCILGIDGCSHHLLYKLSPELFGGSHAHAARYAEAHLGVCAHQLLYLVEVTRHEFAHTSVVAFVF